MYGTDKNLVMPFNKILLSVIYVKIRLARELLVWNSCTSYNEFNENLTDGLFTLVHVWKDGWTWSPRKTFLFSFVKGAQEWFSFFVDKEESIIFFHMIHVYTLLFLFLKTFSVHLPRSLNSR
jgi:hypothetical protein